MLLKKSPAVAFALLAFSLANFAAPITVLPSAGGDGIQAALDKLPAGGEIVLQPGKYLVQKPIMLQKDGQTLRGCGTSTVLALADNANCPVVIVGSLTAHTKNVRLADVMIDGNRTKQPKEVWKFLPSGGGVYNNGVDVWGPFDSTVENVTCAHCRSGGMVSSTGTRRLTVRNYTAFDSQFDGLACYDTEGSHFSGLNLHDNLAAAISLDLDFNHNIIENAMLTGDDLGVFMRQSHDNVFADVTITKSRHHGVFMAGTLERKADGVHLIPNSVCTGNRFCELQISRCDGKAFLVNDRGCDRNSITRGEFTDNRQGGLVQVAPNMVIMTPAESDNSGETANTEEKTSLVPQPAMEKGPVVLAHTAL